MDNILNTQTVAPVTRPEFISEIIVPHVAPVTSRDETSELFDDEDVKRSEARDYVETLPGYQEFVRNSYGLDGY